MPLGGKQKAEEGREILLVEITLEASGADTETVNLNEELIQIDLELERYISHADKNDYGIID